jgi:inhibitor of cysteine peptidase
MEVCMNKRIIIYLILAIVLLSLAACGGTAEATPPADPGDGVQYDEAPVESVEVMMLESFPLQVQLKVEGYMPDGCTQIESTEVEQQDNHFEVTLTTSRPTDLACTEAIEPFEMNIPLDVYGLPAGEYSVDVNGVEALFTFEQDNLLAE